MKFSSDIKEDIAIENVHLTRATYNYAEEFKEILEKDISEKLTNIVVNLKECKYMDSTFLGTLVSTAKKLRELGGSLKIANLHSETLVLFEITGMMRIFEVYKSVEEAITSYSSAVE
ncbi:MAG: anti-sigma factor antagonist [Ignavibacteriales bacterium CG12_big_fil_rev_8_21_14_0_65_30_8]|nr:MAG: anti-sigma factor antagonist [Ignavibacteriales bacterium CG12_big_fil_rev_8_21_14_0_65_30_8]